LRRKAPFCLHDTTARGRFASAFVLCHGPRICYNGPWSPAAGNCRKEG
jgi:hypothetical protein